MKITHSSLHRSVVTKLAAVASSLLALVIAAPQSANASGANPAGINIGFDFVWDTTNSPNGVTASFIENDGVKLSNCGPSTATTKGCHFVFEYSVGSFTQPAVARSGTFTTWSNPTGYETNPAGITSPKDGGCRPSRVPGENRVIPLTLNDCFNANSFGQIFFAGATGTLSNFKMSMTCLQPAGQKIELYALIYELNDPATSIKGTAPIASTKLDLSTCPTATTWQGKTFAASDFAMIPFNFKNVTLTQGVPYGVYFAGSAVPGTAPAGATDAVAAASGTTEDELQEEMPTELKTLSAIRLIEKGDKTKELKSLTPTTCLAVGERVLAINDGECKVQIRSTSTASVSAQAARGKVLSTFTTTVKTDGTQAGLAVNKKTTLRYDRYSPFPKRIPSTLVKQAKAAEAVVILGHTAIFTGNSASNTKLSLERARYVRRHLINQKVKPSAISVAGVAARQPVNTKLTEKDQQANRRVEVYYLS